MPSSPAFCISMFIKAWMEHKTQALPKGENSHKNAVVHTMVGVGVAPTCACIFKGLGR